MKKNRPFLTTGEIVRIAKVHPHTVVMWRYTGKIVPVDRVASAFIYDKKAVLEFLAKRQQKQKQEEEREEKR